jgi:electron transport complex protein RnfE
MSKPLATTRVAALLMLCPLLAVSDSVINALGLSIVAMLVTLAASIPLSMTLQRLPEYGRIAIAVAIIASVVTAAALLVNAYFHELYLAIGAYLPLLIGSGLLIARYEVAVQPSPDRSLVLAGLRTGAVFSAVLLGLGATREFVGHGSLFFGASALPFAGAEKLTRQMFHPDLGFVLALLPPGAFIAMGILFAIRNWIRQRRKKSLAARQ